MFVQIALVVFVVVVYYFGFEWRGKHMIHIQGQGVFVTGCDSGLFVFFHLYSEGKSAQSNVEDQNCIAARRAFIEKFSEFIIKI